ncbi:hypothetical protein Mal15_23270 [Stieleria maiorica]|uniref:Uncharacterized protein n=1 Tax=Stieleria maiorica TaxID=2795974 RepID=A0A5B9MGT0_9BACT|nr:hypothetical protein [Stieleria maiorica]QEF98277.1 hypothetical protein Mal15_23270 [Stieleria maiorica]
MTRWQLILLHLVVIGIPMLVLFIGSLAASYTRQRMRYRRYMQNVLRHVETYSRR